MWQPTPEALAEEREFQRLYGAWDPLAPSDLPAFLDGFAGEWWVVGGWAIEAFTGVPRHHEDVDLVIWRRDLPAFLELVGDRYHVWSAGSGALRPVNADWPEPHEGAGQVWLREHALAPWIVDCLLQDERDGQWVSRRDDDHVAPLGEVTWLAGDGIRYQRPEITLHHKAAHTRPKDDADFDACWPLLDESARAWLREAIARTYGSEHAWLARG